VALIDYEMPEMDGLTLIAEIYKLRDKKALPIILLSSLDRHLIAQTSFAAFLQKPIRTSQLYNTITSVLSEHTPPPTEQPASVQSEVDPNMSQRLPLRILLADDHVTNRKLGLLLLKQLGYHADTAANGLEVLTSIKRQSYDVILMDMQMPEMDGLEATRQVRQRWLGEHGPRISAMTANADKNDYDACMDAGMDDYVVKPIRIKELIFALNKCHVVSVDEAPSSPASASPLNNISSTETVLDPAALQQLRNLIGDDSESFNNLIRSFLEETPTLLFNLRQGMETDDFESMHRAAHTLKSSARDFGAMHLSEVSKQLEALKNEKPLTHAVELVQQAEVAYQPVQIALEECLKAG
jgi:CheY-like chemotaxis protein